MDYDGGTSLICTPGENVMETPAPIVSGYSEASYYPLALVPYNTSTGRHINETQALALSAVWGGIDLIASDMARLPLDLIEVDEDDGITVRRNDPRNMAVRFRANRRQAAQAFWKRFIYHLLLWNHGYARIRRTAGVGVELQHANPWDVQIYDVPTNTFDEAMSRPVAYQVTTGGVNGYQARLSSEEMLHVRGLTIDVADDSCTMPWIGFAKQSIALGLAVQDHGASFFGNGTTSSGTLEFPLGMKPETVDQLLDQFRKLQGGTYGADGTTNAWKVIPLRDGVTWNATGTDPEKSQMNETREQVVREVARWLKIPPHRLGADVKTSSHSSVAEENRAYLTHALSGRMSDITNELDLKLLSRAEHGRLQFRYDPRDFLKPSSKELAETNAIRINSGETTPNEVRKEQGRKPFTDKFADARLIPGNAIMVTPDGQIVTIHTQGATPPGQDDDEEQGQTDEEQDDEEQDGAVMDASRRVLMIAAGKAVEYAIRATKRNPRKPTFTQDVATVMHKGIVEHAAPFAACIGQEPDTVARRIVDWFVAHQLPKLVNATDIAEAATECREHIPAAMLQIAESKTIASQY